MYNQPVYRHSSKNLVKKLFMGFGSLLALYLTYQVVEVVAAAGGVLVEGGNRCDVAIHQAVKDLKPERKYSQIYIHSTQKFQEFDTK